MGREEITLKEGVCCKVRQRKASSLSRVHSSSLPPCHVYHSPHIACYLHISHAPLPAAWLLHTYAQIPTVFIHFTFVSASKHLYGNHSMHRKLMLVMRALVKSPLFSWETVILDINRLDFEFQ